MRIGDPVLLRGVSKALAPLMVLIALGALAGGAHGAGLASGFLLVLALIVHALVFGTAASRKAVPPFAWRLVGAFALTALIAAACAPDWIYARWLSETGAACAIASAGALAFSALAARAPALRDEDW